MAFKTVKQWDITFKIYLSKYGFKNLLDIKSIKSFIASLTYTRMY